MGVTPSDQTPSTQGRECLNCGRSFGDGMSCQFCGQVEGLPVGVVLASAGRRLGGYLLSSLLVLVTLGVGYAIWCFLVYGRGQNPSKQLLGMRVVRLETGKRAGWGTMFVRGWIYAAIVGFISAFLLYIPLLWILWDKRNQELWDKMAETIVVKDPTGLV
jgi:uncharacterized RDD family membrane protein YckC